MKTLFALGFSLFSLGAAAVPVMQQTVCTTDADCLAGETCTPSPCPAIACDPADPTCVVPECLNYCTSAVADPPTGECQSDTDCGPGYECIVVGMSGGSGCACPSDQPDCGCSTEPAPPPTEFKACSPKPCAVDADCGEAQKCVTYEYPCDTTSFAPPSDGSGEAPPPPDPTTCTPQKYTQCEYAWQGECKADADCGAGFACKEQEDCVCSAGTGTGEVPASSGGSSGSDPSGGAPAPEADAGSPSEKIPAPVDPDTGTADCTCAPSGRFFCELQTVECQADADCAPGLVCGSDYGVSGGGATEPATCDEAGNCSSPTPTEPVDPADAGSAGPPAPKTCGYPWKYLADQTGGPSTGGGTEFPTAGGEGAGNPQTSDGSTDENAAPTGANGDSTGAPSSGSSKAAVAAGCTVDSTASASPLAAMFLGLLGLIALRRRSRQS